MNMADDNNALGCQGEWKKMQDEVWRESVTLEMVLFYKSNTLCNIYLLDRHFQNLF